MKLINEDIKTGNLKQLYLLYGEEAYLRRQYRDRLKETLAGEDTMNCHYFEGKDVNTGAVIDLAQTLPFLAQRRVILIENSGLFKKGGDSLADYVKEMAPTAYFVFAETEVDKRSRLFKAVKDRGRAVEFTVQDEDTLGRWIAGIVKREQKQIGGGQIRYFLEKVGADMASIRTELEKLLCYTLKEERITEADIDAVCTRRTVNQIFDMVDAIAAGDRKKALGLYYDLLALREAPMRILFLIARQFNLLLQVKDCRRRGLDNRTIGEKTGLRPFLIGKYASQAARFEDGALRAALEDCVEAEEEVKTGKINDRLRVEMLIVQRTV